MATSNNNSGGYDLDTHYLLVIKEPPESLIALRRELLNHPDICEAAQKGNSFEECIGIIAAKLDIVLDGLYEGDNLCAMLLEVLKKRGTYTSNPSLRYSRLIDVELVEREGVVSIESRDRKQPTILPDGAVVTTSNSQTELTTSKVCNETTEDTKKPQVSN